jgi:hypothetical protein
MEICSFEGCGRKHQARGFCPAHWKQWKKGTPLRPLGWRLGPNEVVEDGERCWLILTDIQGHEVARTCIDREDLEEVAAHRWKLNDRKTKYVVTLTSREKYLHRFLMQPDPKQEVDHWDRDGLNNCRANLKAVQPCLNKQNVSSLNDLPRGVSYRADRANTKPWVARVVTGGKTYREHHATQGEAEAAARRLRALHLTHSNESNLAIMQVQPP